MVVVALLWLTVSIRSSGGSSASFRVLNNKVSSFVSVTSIAQVRRQNDGLARANEVAVGADDLLVLDLGDGVRVVWVAKDDGRRDRGRGGGVQLLRSIVDELPSLTVPDIS